MAKAATGSLLSLLNIVDEKKPAPQQMGKDPVKNYIAGLEEQIGFVKREIAGEPLPLTKSGKKPRLVYWKKGLEFFVSVQYGSVPMDLGGGSTIKAGKTLAEVEKVLNTLKEAAQKGELDEPIHAAAAAISKRLAGKGGRRRA
jgi:hypothetical protein